MDYCEYKDFKKYYKPGAKLIKFNDAKVGDILQKESTTMIKLSEDYEYDKGKKEQAHSNAFNLNSGHYAVVHPDSRWVLVKSIEDF